MSKQFSPNHGPIIDICLWPGGQSVTQAQASAEIQAHPLLIDTGADVTCISQHLVAELGLSPAGVKPVMTPTGQGQANTYLVDVGVPFAGNPTNMFILQNVTVMEFNGHTAVYQGLLGRDFICKGILTLNFDGRFTFSL